MVEKKYVGIIGVALILVVIMASGCIDNKKSGNNTTNSNTDTGSALTVTDLKVISQGYGSYDVKATITPNKDISYLEMVAISYDSSGAIIEKNSMIWYVNEAKKGQVYKVTGHAYVTGNEKPVKMDILIFDSAFSSGNEENNIFKQTVNIK